MASPSASILPALDAWIDRARRHLLTAAPDLAGLVDDYAGEARFGASVIAGDLSRVGSGARVLEIGAGTGLLSAALQAAGYRVTALEPLGAGFTHMARLRGLVDDYTGLEGLALERLDIGAESLTSGQAFDLAFSINVMEHVGDVGAVLRGVWAALGPGASYHFLCPNYRFPFEPHFGIPTLGTKALTWRVFERRILASPVVVDPAGTWASLNWISVAQVRRLCRREFGVTPEFDRGVTYRFVQRALVDPSFQRRHGLALRTMARAADGLGLARLAFLVPPGAQPAMSCRITRPR
ncbi:MAG: methyltransferase [Acidobacteria bacterium]|nr:methyltransferase [Acidobacteriota bacterium]